jgi:murein DD-endopeptidase MepM/ murein hydrolase activator NlpD
MDISLKIGTPIIAVADGVVVQVATGGRLIGNMIMLRHAPKDTGFDLWTFSKYQHLDKPSKLEIGARIKKGDMVGFGGKTGTTGGHFGTAGYAHLHINIYANSTGKYKQGKGVKLNIRDKMYVDPLAIFLKITLNSHELRKMPQLQKNLSDTLHDNDWKIFP